MRGCNVQGCQGRHEAHGYCPKHYYRWRKFGDAGTNDPVKPRTFCQIEECDKPTAAWGMCNKHYRRWKKWNDPLYTQHVQSIGNTLFDKFWSRVNLTADDNRCWTWRGANTHGYGAFTWQKHQYRATHMAWFLTHDTFPTLWMLHSCDNPSCVNPKHLREGTSQDNIQDKMDRHRQLKGEQVPQSKLTSQIVQQIKLQLRQHHSMTKIAQTYNVSIGLISQINANKIWKHVNEMTTLKTIATIIVGVGIGRGL